MSTTYKIVYLNPDSGELGRLPDLAIINAGGVVGPTFTVGGRGLLFDDGSSTGGSSSFSISLQAAYDQGNGEINLTSGKNFLIRSLNTDIFSVDAATGKVTITGDLEVQGSSTVIEGTVSNLDQVVINPPVATSTALIIEPQVGVVMTSNLVTIRVQNGGPLVFAIDQSGSTYIRDLHVGSELAVDGDLTVNGLINTVDVLQLKTDLDDHLANDVLTKHTAEQIDVAGPFQAIVGSNVEEALASIDTQLSVAAASVQTWEHIQNIAALTWTISHSRNSMRPTVSIYDTDGILIWPDVVQIVDSNTITISFNTAQAGRAVILFF
jgi:hypothetical protein